MAGVGGLAIWLEVRDERVRAHHVHGDTSMESSAPDTYRRMAILAEEVGEVAKEFNEAEHNGRPVDLAAMAGAWADACGASEETLASVLQALGGTYLDQFLAEHCYDDHFDENGGAWTFPKQEG